MSMASQSRKILNANYANERMTPKNKGNSPIRGIRVPKAAFVSLLCVFARWR